MPTYDNHTHSDSCCTKVTKTPCVADLKPAPKCLRHIAARNDSPAIKAWLIQKCVSGLLVASYEGDDGATPISAPNGASLPGAFNDYKEVACPQAIAPTVTTLAPNGTAIGKDCAGDELPAVPTHGTFKTIPHPTAVQLVKICGDKPKFDREMVTLCAPDGTRVLVQNVTPEDSPLGTAPVFEAYTLAGAVYAGAITALTDCATEKVDLTDGEDYCLNGVNYSRVDGIDVKTGFPVFTVWLNDAGVPVAAPVGASKGICKPCEVTKHFEFLGYTTPATNGLQPKVLGFFQSINADFSQSTIGDYEVIFTIDGASQVGNAAGTIWPGNYPVPSTGIQSFADYLNNHPANTAPKDIWSVAGTTGNEALVIAATAGGNPPNHVWGSVGFAHYTAGTHDYMTIKGDPTSADVEIAVPASCRKIEVLKEVDCNRNLTLFGFELDGTPIAGFDPSKLVAECPAAQLKNRIYLKRNSGVLTLSDIKVTIGNGKIVSVTVKQISGIGLVSGDSGTGAPLDTTETWEWGEKDFLDGSLLSMNAGTGEQRITAVYVI